MEHNLFQSPEGVGKFKWRFVLFKRYWDTGYTMTGYIKYLVALFGIASLDVKSTILFGLIYGVSCFFIGWAWFYFKFADLDAEVNNRVNWFVKEMRDKIK